MANQRMLNELDRMIASGCKVDFRLELGSELDSEFTFLLYGPSGMLAAWIVVIGGVIASEKYAERMSESMRGFARIIAMHYADAAVKMHS